MAPGTRAATDPDGGSSDAGESGGSTKALVKALRAYSSEKWWQVGGNDGAQEAPARRRGKPEEFQRACAEKHAEMKKVYESAMMQDSEQRWLRKVSGEGTSGDRVASLTMLIQVCPIFATGHIKALLGMAGRTERSDSIMAMDGLKDLFITGLLPDRKLRTLAQMEPISPKGLSKAAFTERCVVAFFEDYLKTAFAAFVQIISEIGHSNVVFFKSKAIKTAYELLVSKPEQERALLALLVNKFGDLAPKVSSNASFCIKRLAEAHPAMKSIIVKEVEAFLARPNITQKSKYFALLYLSEIVYSKKDGELAAQLVRLFVGQLEVAVKSGRKGLRAPRGPRWQSTLGARRPGSGLVEDDSRLIRTLVAGIQRALPYLSTITASGSPLQAETVDALFRVGHTVSGFSTRIAVMTLLFRCLGGLGGTGGTAVPDRFYRLLHEQISHFDLFHCAHRLQALLLLRRCVPGDACGPRALALARRLLQLGACGEPALAAAALGLLREVLAARRTELAPLLRGLEAELPGEEEDRRGPGDLGPEEERFGDDDRAPAGGAAGAEAAAAPRRYDPRAREPRFARAGRAPLWELHALACHVHPFLAHGASQLLTAGTYKDTADNPFQVFSISELMDQFVSSSRAHRGPREKGAKARVTFNAAHFARRKSVAPHERFLQRYFQDSTVVEVKSFKDEQRMKNKTEEDVDEEGAKSQEEHDDRETQEDAFFHQYLEGELPRDDDEDGEDDEDDADVDIDDDGEEGEEGEDQFEPEIDGDADTLGEGEGSEVEGPGKRSAAQAGLRGPGGKRAKTRRGDSAFASVEDFEHLLEESM